MIAAAVAAGVAVSAAAASTALQATQGGPDLPTLGGASGLEARMRRRNRDILFDAEGTARRGAFEQNLVTPDLYRLAGYEPEYDQGSIDEAVAARSRADEASSRFGAARAKLDSLTGAAGKRELKSRLAGLKGKERRQARKAFKKERRHTRQDLRISRGQMDTLGMVAGAAEANAGRITGLKRVGLGDETDREIDRLMGERALNALRTGESDDPRLNRELAEQEGEIRARLARQFGADYENTTGGQMALNAFRRGKRESLADFARKDIGYESERVGLRGALARNAAAEMGLTLMPSQARFSSAESLGNIAARFQNFNQMLQHDRLAQFESQTLKAQAEYDAEAQRTAAIAGGLSQLAQGASSYGLSTAGGGSWGSRTMGQAAGAGR